MGSVSTVVDPEVRLQEEELAWASVGQTIESMRVRWRRVLERVHEQRSGPLVMAYIRSDGWDKGWYLFVLATPETRLPRGDAASREHRTAVWKCILEGELLSGPWQSRSEVKADGAWRVVQADGRWGS